MPRVLARVIRVVRIHGNDDLLRIHIGQSRPGHDLQLTGPVEAGAQRRLGHQNRAVGLVALQVFVHPLKHRHVLLDAHTTLRQDGRDLIADLEVSDLGIRREDVVDLALDVLIEQVLVPDEAQQVESESSELRDGPITGALVAPVDLDAQAVQSARTLQRGERIAVRVECAGIDVHADVRRPFRSDIRSEPRIDRTTWPDGREGAGLLAGGPDRNNQDSDTKGRTWSADDSRRPEAGLGEQLNQWKTGTCGAGRSSNCSDGSQSGQGRHVTRASRVGTRVRPMQGRFGSLGASFACQELAWFTEPKDGGPTL